MDLSDAVHKGQYLLVSFTSDTDQGPGQVTRPGGHAAIESLNGKFIYSEKNPMPEPEIWRVPTEPKSNDSRGEKPLPLVRPGWWASWQVTAKGIPFGGPSLGHQAVLSFYDFARDRTIAVAVLNRIPFWLGATPDGKTVGFDQSGEEQAQAMLVEKFPLTVLRREYGLDANSRS